MVIITDLRPNNIFCEHEYLILSNPCKKIENNPIGVYKHIEPQDNKR